jgi:hypothetical protein
MKIIIQVVVLVALVRVWMLSAHKRAVRRNYKPIVTHAPMFEPDRERMKDLKYIYNKNDVEAVNMLWMRRAHFNHLVTHLGLRVASR